MTTRMPTNVANAHDLLGRELCVLWTKWSDYKILYCKSKKTVEMLDHAASFFFRIVREVLRDDIIISVCRMTDPATATVSGVRKDNLTIAQLVSMIMPMDNKLCKRLGALQRTIVSCCAPFRVHRNRRIGHCDLNTRLKHHAAFLPGISIADTQKALQSIGVALNAVELHYDGKKMDYQQGIYGSGNGRELIEFIERAKQLQKYYDRHEYGGFPKGR
jgi:AbiU2